MPKTLSEHLPDRRRICIYLRADGWSYEEIAEFLGVGVRMVRHELEKATEAFPELLGHRREGNQNRLIRLIYLIGVSDAGGDPEEMTDRLDMLVQRAEWLRSRMIARERLRASMEAARTTADFP